MEASTVARLAKARDFGNGEAAEREAALEDARAAIDLIEVKERAEEGVEGVEEARATERLAEARRGERAAVVVVPSDSVPVVVVPAERARSESRTSS